MTRPLTKEQKILSKLRQAIHRLNDATNDMSSDDLDDYEEFQYRLAIEVRYPLRQLLADIKEAFE